MNDLPMQLERLKRNYDHSLKTYDAISLLELAASLRIWTEMAETIDSLLDEKKFQRFPISRNIKKILRGSEYSYSYLHNGVTVSSAATKEKSTRTLMSGPFKDRAFTVSSLIKVEQNGDVTVSEYMLVYRKFSDYESNMLAREVKNKEQVNISYAEYLQAPAIYFQIGNHVPNHITNAELIKRVANEYGASHSVKNSSSEEFSNRFSAPVKELMQYNVSSLPLPYFVLLHIAQSIINGVDKAERDQQ